jgi:hypothetical protein
MRRRPGSVAQAERTGRRHPSVTRQVGFVGV